MSATRASAVSTQPWTERSMGWPDASLLLQGVKSCSSLRAAAHAAPITSDTRGSAEENATKVRCVIGPSEGTLNSVLGGFNENLREGGRRTEQELPLTDHV